MSRLLAALVVAIVTFGTVYLTAPVANAKPQNLTTVSSIAVASSPRSEVPVLTSLKSVKVPAQSQKRPQPIKIVDIQVVEQRAKAKIAHKAKAKSLVRNSTVKKKTYTSKRTHTSKKVYIVSTGNKASSNWATPGQCTWGALNKWYRATGWYLGGFHGNAGTWNERARAAGHSVGYTPRSRSIVVFEAGVAGASSVGHVGWVTSVSGSKVTFVEMNAMAGPFNYNTRTVTHRSGMSYIYAP